MFGCNAIIELLALLGAIFLVFIVGNTICNWLKIARAVLAKYFLPNEKYDLVSKYGKWAVVTGCTDGIGKEFAKELALRELNIVLISRNLEKLTNTAKEIESKYSVKTKIIVADFSVGKEVYKHIEKELEGIPVAILVNNVGSQYSYPKYITEASEEELWSIINVNVGAVTMMSKIIIPQMRERRKGAIVNVSSGSELVPLPLMNVYAATKAYVRYFTEALRFECSAYNITIQHLAPMYISTKMNAYSHRFDKSSLFIPDAKMYAHSAVKTLGKLNCTTGYWSHGIQYFVTSLAPVWLRTYLGGYMNVLLRKDYYIKQQKGQT